METFFTYPKVRYFRDKSKLFLGGYLGVLLNFEMSIWKIFKSKIAYK